ncbi:MAG TPA: efflux RND transporter periplasmic adaptor subunit [Acidisarcina sp.]
MQQDAKDGNNPQGQQPEHGHDGGAAAAVKPVRGSRVVLGLIILMVIAAILVVTGIVPRVRARSRLADQTNSLAAPTVLVAKPDRGVPSQEVILPGNVQAYTDSPIYARTSGYLRKWYFDIGAHVKKGQLLAEIESPEVDQQLAQARADLATAQANAANAQTNAKRYNDLIKSDAVSQQDVDAFNTQAASSSTVVQSAVANVQRIEQLVGFERITAPFDGVITARNIDTGQLITAGSGTELFHEAAVNTLRVYVNVPQVYSRDAVPGITADLTFSEFPGRRFQGRLVRTSNQIDPVSRTLLAEIQIDNRKGELVPGAYAEVHLRMKEGSPTYIIPASALMYRAEGLRVGTIVSGNKARMTPVVIGEDDGRTIQVISGLDVNSQVILDPPDSLIDGEELRISPQHPPSAQAGGAQGQPGQGQAGQGGQAAPQGGQGGNGNQQAGGQPQNTGSSK